MKKILLSICLLSFCLSSHAGYQPLQKKATVTLQEVLNEEHTAAIAAVMFPVDQVFTVKYFTRKGGLIKTKHGSFVQGYTQLSDSPPVTPSIGDEKTYTTSITEGGFKTTTTWEFEYMNIDGIAQWKLMGSTTTVKKIIVPGEELLE